MVSFLHLYAAHGRSGAYLSQPTLTGRFLISSHCQPEHLRRLLPRWPEMSGWLRWKDVERGGRRGRVGESEKDKGERKTVMREKKGNADVSIYAMIPPFKFLWFLHTFNTSHGQPDLSNSWEIKDITSSPLVMKILDVMKGGFQGQSEVFQLDQQPLLVLS